ncbi:GrlR family regulatory protein [Burkholderia orbicola]|uniref:GrlR family regulatory protein n=1 Tax=Burkholderia orbicola TaxID=2978683 RepID=UPI0019032844|nr:GrlR family regulatory protein [Burkholderia orbicola]MBK1821296.1 hypothetical protein [Burkholderia orbicola]
MTIEGFYRVEFGAAIPGAGGVVVVEGGRLRGADDQYLYSGTVSGPDERLHVEIIVKAYAPGAVSVFQTVGGTFQLTLTGNVTGSSFQVSGPAPFPGMPGITVRGTRVADIDLT